MKIFLSTVALFFVSSFYAQAQKDTSLSKSQWNKALNKVFGGILGAKTDNTTIGNYASFDAAAGSFDFKGSIAIGKDSTKISYISLGLKGDLLSDNYSVLFNNSKINTNTEIQADWHIRLGKNRFIIDDSYVGEYRYIENLEKLKKRNAVRKSLLEPEELTQQIDRLSFQNQLSRYDIELKVRKIDTLTGKIDSLKALGIETHAKLLKVFTDSMNAIISASDKLKSDTIALRFKADSLAIIRSNLNDYSYYIDRKISTESATRIKILDSILIFDAVKFNWFTFIAAAGKKAFYTYNRQLPFSSQLDKKELKTWKLGIAWNYFNQNKETKRIIYFNIKALGSYDNNTSLLTTQEISQEITIKNAVGDTVRKISKKYNAYTDPVDSSKRVSVSSNLYYLFGKKLSGFHFFPSLEMPRKLKSNLTLGFGYLISFTNLKKDQPIINAEGYIQFNDVLDHLDVGNVFWKRNEIGVRFTLPFGILK